MHPLLALAISATVAGLGWRLRALTVDGALAATAVGLAILTFTGWPGLAVLGTFFVSSTVVSRTAAAADRRDQPNAADIPDAFSDQAETETRNRWQVLANGGAAAVGAVLEPFVSGLGIWLVSITLAAAAGDTWSTAFGRLIPPGRAPRDILSRRPVPPGTSGGVTWFGTTGGLMGATMVGLVGASTTGAWSLYAAATAIGFGAMLLDSGLGSAVQSRFHCDRCDRPTERRVHHCGARTTWRRGWRWLDNDGVNAVATAVAGLAGLAAWWL